MPKVFVTPAMAREGRRAVVRDPFTKLPIPPEGAEVELDNFIRRRIREGGLIVGKASAEAPPVKHAAKPKQEG